MIAVPVKSALPPGTLWIAALLVVVGGIGPESLLALLAVAVLLFGTWLLWRPGESPILLFVFGYQWLQASIKAFQANWSGLDFVQSAPYGGDVGYAMLLSLLALVALALGMRVGAGPWRPQDGALTRNAALEYGPREWFRIYAAAFVVASLLQAVAWMSQGLTQPLLALANLKWAFYWILAYVTFARPGSRPRYLLMAFCLEMLVALGAFFADFKTPVFFTMLAAVAARRRFSIRQYLGLASLAVTLLLLALIWTSVKQEYRSFASGGQGQQITVGYSERITRLADLVMQVDGAALEEAATDLVDRISYVDFFGLVLNMVPRTLPHEEGALWWDAITRPFMPRLFFPDKTPIDDSVRTNYYTGLAMSGTEEGTSISLGYVAESYIDFGAIGMMLPIFALGCLLGGFYRWMLNIDPAQRLLGIALATATVYGASYLEASITKVFGGLIVTMLVSWVVIRFMAPRFLQLGLRLSATSAAARSLRRS